MQLRTLGASEILIGDTRIGVEQPTIFTCLLLLALAYPRRLPRAGVAADLWPSAPPPRRNHRLRTLLYRCRQLGAPVVADEAFVGLSEAPVVDFRVYSMPPRSVLDARARADGLHPVLPGIEVLRAACAADQLDDARAMIAATITRWSNSAMSLARSAGEWDVVARLASAARAVDELNATAWLNLAEAECLTGHRPLALRTLDEYLMFVADRGDAPYASARALRQRFVAEGARGFEPGPHVARSSVMRRLWTALSRAQRGRGGAFVVWGPAGIGKTRLLEEAERAVVASGARVASMAVQPVHCLRRTGLVSDLVARLIDAPGGAGCDPDAYHRLRALAESNDGTGSRPNEPLDGRLFQDVTELLSALTEESPLGVVIDDAHFLDADSWPFWRALIRWSCDRRVLWLFAIRAIHESELRSLPHRTFLPRVALVALDRGEANTLLESNEPDPGYTFDTIGGNPLLLRAAAEPFDVELGARADAAIDDTFTRLTNDALAIIGALASADGVRERDLARMLPLHPSRVRGTLIELLRAGIVHDTDGVLRLYPRWADAFLASYPMSSPPMSAAMMAF